jgi:hypothetical protein
MAHTRLVQPSATRMFGEIGAITTEGAAFIAVAAAKNPG